MAKNSKLGCPFAWALRNVTAAQVQLPSWHPRIQTNQPYQRETTANFGTELFHGASELHTQASQRTLPNVLLLAREQSRHQNRKPGTHQKASPLPAASSRTAKQTAIAALPSVPQHTPEMHTVLIQSARYTSAIYSALIKKWKTLRPVNLGPALPVVSQWARILDNSAKAFAACSHKQDQDRLPPAMQAHLSAIADADEDAVIGMIFTFAVQYRFGGKMLREGAQHLADSKHVAIACALYPDTQSQTVEPLFPGSDLNPCVRAMQWGQVYWASSSSQTKPASRGIKTQTALKNFGEWLTKQPSPSSRKSAIQAGVGCELNCRDLRSH